MHVIDLKDFNNLFTLLSSKGYTLVGPKVHQGAIVYDVISSLADLPRGWIDQQDPAVYRLRPSSEESYFGYVVGPQSWKKFLFPPRLRMVAARRVGKGFEIVAEEEEQPRYAFIGVRPCDLQAIAIQDKVFATGEYVDPTYMARREQAFVVAVNCTRPGGNCFCTSMGTGPKALSGYDLVLTEMCTQGPHVFMVESGTERGSAVLAELPHRDAEQGEIDELNRIMDEAATQMGKTMEAGTVSQFLRENLEHPHWDDVANRCLACANCTLVCPTCFCSTVEDLTDLAGDAAERVRRWDSCFTSDFTKIAGGNIRLTTRTRYRQWMMHKLAHWVDQFGVLGCVGCGRCITWCPVGIDITNEVNRMRQATAPVPAT
jgi:sulfhydrogenase subunit beta (sulfur reductase)